MQVKEDAQRRDKMFDKWEHNLAEVPPAELKRIAAHALASLENLVAKDSAINIFEAVTGRKPFYI